MEDLKKTNKMKCVFDSLIGKKVSLLIQTNNPFFEWKPPPHKRELTISAAFDTFFVAYGDSKLNFSYPYKDEYFQILEVELLHE